MGIAEASIWSAMFGGLLTLTALAILDVVVNRSIGAIRNLIFVIIASLTCVMITGLPFALWPGLPERLLTLLIVGLVPLSAAIALNTLGGWLGGRREDALVHRITTWGGRLLLVCSLALALLATQAFDSDFQHLKAASAGVNMVAVLAGLFVSIRAATLGDPLARWMVLACTSLALMSAGLSLRALNVAGLGLGTWALTAIFTVGFFLVSTVLIILRNRENRHLARLAGLEFGADPATGLPTGSVLLSKVDHAFWRTGRLGGECTVVCLHLRNLYELGEAAGHGVEHQILAAMAARIRRAAGFRCVVGLYHPRCFVVVISADKRRQFVTVTCARLRTLISQRLSVLGRDGALHDFTPHLGIGVVTVNPRDADPLETITNAERQALGPESPPHADAEDFADTTW